MIIVLGDSWSSDVWQSPTGGTEYDPLRCLRSQIEQASGEFVLNFSYAGSNLKYQLEKIPMTIDPNTRASVLLAATDWYRDRISHKITSETYEQALSSTRNEAAKAFRKLAKSHSNLAWYHWGGQNCVWYEQDLPQNHTVLFRDYAHEVYGAPPAETGLHSYWQGIKNFVAVKFSSNSKQEHKDLIRRTMDNIKYRASHPSLYQDGGHLNWCLYKDLVQRFLEHHESFERTGPAVSIA